MLILPDEYGPIVDLSRWNVPIHPDILFPQIAGAIIRSNVGAVEDAEYKNIRALFDSRGEWWSPYMFYLASINREEQAHIFAELNGHIANGEYIFDGWFGAYVDIEASSKPLLMTAKTFTTRFFEFYDEWLALTNYDLFGIYCTKWYIEQCFTDAILPYTKDNDMALWIAHWNTTTPNIPRYWEYSKPQFILQQREGTGNRKGAEYGVGSADIDLNIFNGTEQDFLEYFGLVEKPVEPPTEEKLYVKVTTPQLRIRTSPDTTTLANYVGYFLQNKIISVDGMVIDAENRPWYYIGEQKDYAIYFAAWLTAPVYTQ